MFEINWKPFKLFVAARLLTRRTGIPHMKPAKRDWPNDVEAAEDGNTREPPMSRSTTSQSQPGRIRRNEVFESESSTYDFLTKRLQLPWIIITLVYGAAICNDFKLKRQTRICKYKT